MGYKNLIGYTCTILLIVLTFNACRNRQEKGTSSTKEPGILYQQQFMQRLESINPGLKDPSAVLALIESTGAEYLPGLVNNSGLDSIYLRDSAISAIVLGMYTVDLVYLLTYERFTEFDVQLERARNLADNIGAGYLYDHGLYRRYRAAGVHPDTLIKYLDKSSKDLEHDFGKMELLRISTLFATGEFIEKLHLTTNLLIHADRDKKEYYWAIMMLFFQQQKALDQLIHLLDRIRGEEEGERFMALMSDLKLMYTELTSSDVLSGVNTHNISDNQLFIDIHKHIDHIRELIIYPGEM